MPEINISFEKAEQFYITEVSTVLRKLRSGSAGRGKKRESQLKNRKVDPALINWYLCWNDNLESIDLSDTDLNVATLQALESVKKISLLGRVDDWEGRAAISMFQGTPADIVETITSQIKSRLDARRQLEELPDSVRLQLQAIQDAEDLEKVRGNIRRKARNVFMKAFVESGLEAIALAEDSQEFFDALGATLSKEMVRHFNTYTQDN